jgi:hypothetical protein
VHPLINTEIRKSDAADLKLVMVANVGEDLEARQLRIVFDDHHVQRFAR